MGTGREQIHRDCMVALREAGRLGGKDAGTQESRDSRKLGCRAGAVGWEGEAYRVANVLVRQKDQAEGAHVNAEAAKGVGVVVSRVSPPSVPAS